MAMKVKELIRRHADALENYIESDTQFIDVLLSMDVLSRSQSADIKAKWTVFRRNKDLLEILASKTEEQCRVVLRMLDECGQQHVANFIRHDGDMSFQHDDCWPLDELKSRLLDVNRPHLMEFMNPDERLIAELAAVSCISQQQRTRIRQQQTDVERNEMLLDILTRRSLADFKNFVTCLSKSGQLHIADDVLFKKGLIVNVDAVLDDAVLPDTDSTENQIVKQFRDSLNSLSGISQENRQHALDALHRFNQDLDKIKIGIQLIALNKRCSIGCYFFCNDIDSLRRFYEIHQSGKLGQLLENFFTEVLAHEQQVQIKSLEWSKKNYDTCVYSFQQITGTSQDTVERHRVTHRQTVNEMATQIKMSDLESAKVHPHYLHSNSTSHTWVFGAFAELIDNVHDLGTAANLLRIDAVKLTDDSGWCITFTDDGNGLSSESLLKMLCFGYTDKHRGANPVGQYGNGFNSASMRIGKDALVFTKCRRTQTMSVGFLSQTFHEKIDADTVFVPVVEWDTKTKKLSSEAHQSSLDIILQHSIFHNETDLLSEFEFGHKSTAGTRIVIFNLRIHAKKLELDLESDKHDILSSEGTGIDGYCRPEPKYIPGYRRSLKQYCAILYLESRVKILVRGDEVKRIKISETLSDSKEIDYKPIFLKFNEKLQVTYGMARPGKDYGMCLYYRQRLISAYKKVGCQKRLSKTDGDQVPGYGVVGVVDVDPVLTPIHTKQDFEKNEHYNACMNTFNVKLRQYWREIKGVTDAKCADDDDSWVQCKLCKKYRRLTDGTVADDLPDSWNCSMNTDTCHNRCEVAQEKNSSTSLTYLDIPTRKRKQGQALIATQSKKSKCTPANKLDQLNVAGQTSSTDVANEVAEDGEVRVETVESSIPTTSGSSGERRQTRSCTSRNINEPETGALTDSQTADSPASRQRQKHRTKTRSNVTSRALSSANQCSNPKCVEVRTRLDCLRMNIMSVLHDKCTHGGCVEPEDVDKLMDDLARQIMETV